jgi:hypothetical protein
VAGGMGQKIAQGPHGPRRGWLKNGNPPGDFLKAPRCGARTRRGALCQCPAMRNGRCRIHGGLSTGPKTPEGRERSRMGPFKHGRYSKAVREEERRIRTQFRSFRALLHEFRALERANAD